MRSSEIKECVNKYISLVNQYDDLYADKLEKLNEFAKRIEAALKKFNPGEQIVSSFNRARQKMEEERPIQISSASSHLESAFFNQEMESLECGLNNLEISPLPSPEGLKTDYRANIPLAVVTGAALFSGKKQLKLNPFPSSTSTDSILFEWDVNSPSSGRD